MLVQWLQYNTIQCATLLLVAFPLLPLLPLPAHEQLLLLNLRMELRHFLPATPPTPTPVHSKTTPVAAVDAATGDVATTVVASADDATRGDAGGLGLKESFDNCSDVAVVSDAVALIAHNEDADASLLGNS